MKQILQKSAWEIYFLKMFMNLWVNDDDGENDDDDDDDNDNDMLLIIMTMKPRSRLQKDDLAPPRSSSSGCN